MPALCMFTDEYDIREGTRPRVGQRDKFLREDGYPDGDMGRKRLRRRGLFAGTGGFVVDPEGGGGTAAGEPVYWSGLVLSTA